MIGNEKLLPEWAQDRLNHLRETLLSLVKANSELSLAFVGVLVDPDTFRLDKIQEKS